VARDEQVQGSITRWIGELKAGDVAAAQPLWERYFAQLVELARAKLRATHRPAPVEDEEDAALSAFNSFCAGAARGRFPLLSDRDDLWRLLVVITARKACAQIQRRTRQKRGGGNVIAESAMAGADSDWPDGLDWVVGTEPTPEFAAMVTEEYRRLLDALNDDDLRRVALDRMEGYTNDEIAARLGCARRTVARRLDLIRKIWMAEDARA
jgi:DNA-directed RNA polymerase specialized sigma24 family protein